MGLAPTFGRFLGIGTIPVHLRSTAGGAGLHGDLVLVVDLSESMTYASKSIIGAVKSYVLPAGLLVASPTVLLSGNNFEFQTFQDDKKIGPAGKEPFVRVTTQFAIKVPIPVKALGVGLPQRIVLTDACTFPILNPDPESEPIYDLNVEGPAEVEESSAV